jgi:hypothetical protein
VAEQSVHAATTTPDHDGDRSHSAREGFTAAAGMASLASGAIHAAAIGVHAEHRQTALAFTVLALLQLGWGALALVRAGRLVSLAGIAVGLASVGGWVVAKTVGIGLIDGLEVAEAPQTADVVCAALAALSVVLAVLSLLPVRVESTGHSLRVPAVLGVCLLLVLTFSGMAAASSHTHEHGAQGETAADGHTHGTEAGTAGATTAGAHTHAAQAVAPVPYDPDEPIDLGGVDGVTPEQQATAESIVRVTLADLPQWADYRDAEAAGFHSIGDGGTGTEHFINDDFMDDDVVLDPTQPESLVYDTSDGDRRLVAAMYMLERGLPLEDVPDYGGALMQFHTHQNLCYTEDGVLGGLTNGEGECPDGLFLPEPTPMIHVWIEPHPCGPFAALEGIGGGTIEDGEEVLCDEAHGAPA